MCKRYDVEFQFSINVHNHLLIRTNRPRRAFMVEFNLKNERKGENKNRYFRFQCHQQHYMPYKNYLCVSPLNASNLFLSLNIKPNIHEFQ